MWGKRVFEQLGTYRDLKLPIVFISYLLLIINTVVLNDIAQTSS